MIMGSQNTGPGMLSSRNLWFNEMFVEQAHSLADMFVSLDRLGRLD
jgi:hypothetical protein